MLVSGFSVINVNVLSFL